MSGALEIRRLRWLLLIFAAGYHAVFAFNPELYFPVGIKHFGVWFLDSYALLASNDAITQGLDPYGANPLDPFYRAHIYSPWWLHLRDLGLTRRDNLGLGLAFGAAFGFAALLRLRPRSPREVLWHLGILCSSPVLLALNRANNDLVVFALLAPVVPCLLSAHRPVRFLAVPLIAVAAGLKYYPAIAALVLLVGDDPRVVRGRLGFVVVALALVAISVAPDFLRAATAWPKAEGLMTFGAVNLLEPGGLGGWRGAIAALTFVAVVVGGFWRARTFDGWHLAPADRSAWLGFLLGAALLTGCFFTGTSYAYRWIFAIWMAPLLWSLPRDPMAPARVRRLAGLTAALLVFVLWSDAVASMVLTRVAGRIPAAELVAWADRFFLFEQPIFWLFFGCLIGFLAHFVRAGVRTLLARS